MNIPEQNNGYPDILDEARWEIEFFKKMQVTEKKFTTSDGLLWVCCLTKIPSHVT